MVITFESIDMCCTTWYIIQGVYKMESNTQTSYAKEGRQSRNHGKLALKNPRKAIQQTIAILATIIMPLTNTMLHKTHILSMGEKVVDKFFPTRMKWKDLLLDVNVIGEKDGLSHFFENWAIKKTNFNDYIIKNAVTSLLQCSKCKTLKRLQDAHTLKLSLMLHINWIISSMWTCKRHIVIIIIQIECCPSLSHWTSSRSSIIKWTMPKQPHHICAMNQGYEWTSLSYMFWLYVVWFYPMFHSYWIFVSVGFHNSIYLLWYFGTST